MQAQHKVNMAAVSGRGKGHTIATRAPGAWEHMRRGGFVHRSQKNFWAFQTFREGEAGLRLYGYLELEIEVFQQLSGSSDHGD
jgi:hypothetical protein